MQKKMTDTEDKEPFAHGPTAPSPPFSVIALTSLLLWGRTLDRHLPHPRLG